jgi:HAD superfamily hydrolase (TIGR01493 family)
VRWALFDLNGTLLDPAGIGDPLGLSPEQSVLALDETIMLAMAETLSGGDRAFGELLESVLRRRAELTGADASALEEALGQAARMPPYPDAGAAIEAAGLRDALELVIGSDETGAFKPHPQVYRRGVERTGAPADEVWMVASHGWDLLGANRVGLRTAWVRRKEVVAFPTNPRPDATGAGLLELAAAMTGGEYA